jgi:nucleoside-diphosphate-sugar epimerase
MIKESDFCYFLAFDVGGSKYLNLMQKNYMFIANNLQIMNNVFSLLYEQKTPFVFASSQMSNMVNSNYGLLKLIGERITESLSGVSATFWNIYGKETEPEKFHVINDFIRMAVQTDKINLLTNGNEYRDFLHTSDCSYALAVILEKYEEFINIRNIDISSFKWTKILDVAHIISEISGATVIPGLANDSTHDQRLREPNPFLLDFWAPKINLEDGIRDLFGYYSQMSKDLN